ncbi:V-type H(+)-translocating pyrophosphatase, putative [Plasmodium relictum]|uniref:V-type H(+)-translocating pyrophosphatase, putative n=1 Tax=Plasmodium relictum TaxID=85471 RepID=A0A1J1HCN7_PLARL|nr:V-type H(+)-translocating pyrophosphatase, putative [Plasmodium relictum]CRH01354.1 V-type H(+)-translocating pyrophosphatase, putative [Plasmodium relictum]
METLNPYNHNNKLKQELINKSDNIDFYNQKYSESLSTNSKYSVNSYDKEKKFNENALVDISFENIKTKNYLEKMYEEEKNEKLIIPVEIEQNKIINLNNDKYYENICKFHRSNFSSKNKDPENFIKRNLYINKKSHLEIDEEKKKNVLERNEKSLKDQYESHIISRNNMTKKCNNYISNGCKNNTQTESQQTIAYDSQQNLLDMYQNNFHINSQQTLKYDSEQNLSHFFPNNLCTNPKPTLIFEPENIEYKYRRIPFNNNSKQLNFPYHINTFNKYDKNLIIEDEQIVGIQNEENNMKNENIQDLKDECKQKIEDENEQYIKNEGDEILINGNEQNIDNQRDNNTSDMCKQNTCNACEIDWNKQYLNNIYNSYEQSRREQEQQNSLNSYEQNFQNMGINIGNINKNNIYNNQITNGLNNDQLYFNNQLNERGYYNNYGNSHQNNSLLSKIKLQNNIQESFIFNNIKCNSNEQNNESSDGLMTIRTLNMNSNNKKMKENQLKGLNDLCTTKSVFLKTDMHNNNDAQNFKNDSVYDMNINGLRNINASFYEKEVPYQMNTINNTFTNEQENTSTVLQNYSNKNYNFENGQKYLNGKQYLNKYVDNHYKLEEIKNCMPEPTLYTKQTFDIPQIIQGLTTKHNNGIVSECNQDTIIEYDNKWRLVQGKTFSINQNDNFKSIEDSAEAFQKYLDKQNENTKKMLINSNFNSLTGKLVINPTYDENKNNMNKVHDYKDTLHAYPSYYNIPRKCEQNGNIAGKNNTKDIEDKTAFNKNENNDYNSKNEKLTKKKTMVKKQNLALCGDYLLKHRIKDLISVKMKDYFNINLFNHYM